MFKKFTKYLFLTLIFSFFSVASAKAQEKDKVDSRWYLTTGFGYYNPPKDGTGNVFYSEIGYRLSSGYNVGFGFGLSDVFIEYDETSPLLEGERIYLNYYLFRVFINRPFKFGVNNNHQIKIGSGFILVQPRFSYPRVTLVPNYDDQGNIISYELKISQIKSTSNSINAGFPLVFEYGYNFGPLSIGARFETHFLYAVGFGGFIISPQISLDF